ncbi:MAG: hypothetical protein QGG40_03160 [Myxococcota bacterium]|jgi:hypothetical protein|nr:hypothetical protein [Myxococcota bacterium]
MTSTTTRPRTTDNLATTLASWVYLLFLRQVHPEHGGLLAACETLSSVGADGDAEAAGQTLVAAVREALLLEPLPETGNGLDRLEASWSTVERAVTRWFGRERIAHDLGKATDRADRIRSIRQYEFASGTPWLALLLDLGPDGNPGPRWLLVEQVSDALHAMDPTPWDDLDDRVEMPLVEFAVKWELAGNRSLRRA